MASPAVVSTAETAVTSAGTSHAITLPGSIVASDLVLITMAIGSTAATLNALAGWTELLDENLAIGLKILRYSGGGVPSNPTFVTSASTRSATIAWRISGASQDLLQIGSSASGTSATPDPPASAAPPSSKDYLFIALFSSAGEEADDDTWSDTPPANFLPSPPLQKACGTAGSSLAGMIAAASRQLTTGSAQDPGTFAQDVSRAWRAQTITIHPLVAKAVTPAAITSSSDVTASVTKTSPTQTATARISLAAGGMPAVQDQHSLKIRGRVQSGAGKFRLQLWEGANQRCPASGYVESSALSTSLADYTVALADADADTITDYANLEVRVWGYAAAGGSIVFEVDQLWLELPASTAGPKAVTPDAITSSSGITAAVTALHRVIPAAIATSSNITASVAALHRVVPTAITASSNITATVRRARAVVPAAIATSSNITASVAALHRVTPAAISANSSVSATISARRPVVPTAITATSDTTASVQRLGATRAVSPAAITATSSITAALVAQHHVVPVAITASSNITAGLVARRGVAPAAITTTSAITATVTKVSGGTTQTATARISLSPGGFPTSRTGHTIKLRARVTSGAGKIRVAVYEGANNRIAAGYVESGALTTALADYTLTVADADAASITDYSNLEFRVWGFCSGGGAIVFEIDQLWLETPATSPKAITPAAITATSAVTATVTRPGSTRQVIPAAITATSSITAAPYVPSPVPAEGGLGFLWSHGVSTLKAVIPAAISTSSNITAAVGKAGISPKAVTPAAINATSNVTVSLRALRRVAPAAITSTSNVTVAIGARRPVIPTAISATSGITAGLTKQGTAPIMLAAITATSVVVTNVTALHRIITAAITSTSVVTTSLSRARFLVPAAITSTSNVTAVIRRARAIVGSASATSTVTANLRARRAVLPGAITATSDVTIGAFGKRFRLGVFAITATSDVTAFVLGRPVITMTAPFDPPHAHSSDYGATEQTKTYDKPTPREVLA